MKIVSEANASVLSILRKFLKTENCARWLHYCVQTSVEDGILVVNLLTRELVLLSQEEHDHYTELDYLKEHWFVVPEATKEKEYAELVRWVLTARQPKAKNITAYTIFTTTDCNARCFYCFEMGRSRVPMSCETAEKVVAYIKDHSAGQDVNIGWFGGEPLFNVDAIDTIVAGLQGEGIKFRSRMTSNGYLFDDEMVQRAAAQWNLKRVQITLDGTEKVYNKIKAFIYPNTNPFEIVINNIGRLLDASIRVTVRLNMDMYNANDLLNLVEELAQRFAGQKGLTVYAHHLFDADTTLAELHTDEEWEERDAAMCRLTECIHRNGLASKAGISKNIKLNHCMADGGKSVTILPDGSIGLCEHHTESEFIGHIDTEGLDADVLASWKELVPEIPECEKCFYFLDCRLLKKCSSSNMCYRQLRREHYRNMQHKMECEYENWKVQQALTEGDNDNDDC